MPQALDYTKLREGIMKWPECTTTSPSGHHLDIYKSLYKHVCEKPKKNQSQPTADTNQDKIKEGHNILHLIFDIMSLALTHAYPL